MSCEDYVVGQRPRFSAQFRLGSTLTDPGDGEIHLQEAWRLEPDGPRVRR